MPFMGLVHNGHFTVCYPNVTLAVLDFSPDHKFLAPLPVALVPIREMKILNMWSSAKQPIFRASGIVPDIRSENTQKQTIITPE